MDRFWNIAFLFGNNDNGSRDIRRLTVWKKVVFLTQINSNKHDAENQNNECKRKHITAAQAPQNSRSVKNYV